jgi:hypothetical protein
MPKGRTGGKLLPFRFMDEHRSPLLGRKPGAWAGPGILDWD